MSQNKMNQEHTFSKLEEYMFYGENICKWTRFMEETVIKKTDRKNKKHKHKLRQIIRETFSPHQKDKLFWCFFIILKGMDEYNMSQSNLFSIEKDFKFKTIELFRKKKSEMKALKMKLVDIEDNLINGRVINIKTLQALCFVYDKSIIYKQENMYYDFQYGEKYILIENYEKGDEMHMNVSNNVIESIKEKMYFVDVVKPIRGISYYNVTDIHNIASRLGIKIKDNKNKSKTKKTIYQEIIQMIEKLR